MAKKTEQMTVGELRAHIRRKIAKMDAPQLRAFILEDRDPFDAVKFDMQSYALDCLIEEVESEARADGREMQRRETARMF